MAEQQGPKTPSAADKLELAGDVLAYAKQQYAARGFDGQVDFLDTLKTALWVECAPHERALIFAGG